MSNKTLLLQLVSIFILLAGQTVAVKPCDSADYQQNTLKLLKDQTIADSFVDLSEYVLFSKKTLYINKKYLHFHSIM